MLTESQIERYSRQIILPPVGGRGQEALLRAAVAVVGDHEAATTALVYLGAAGVGHLTQAASVSTAGTVNPDVTVVHLPIPQHPEDLAALASAHAVVVSLEPMERAEWEHGACRASGTPLFWGFSEGPSAWVARLGSGPAVACPACLRATIRPTVLAPTDAGLTPIAAAFVGTVMAGEVLKTLLGLPDALAGGYLALDVVAGTVESHRLARVPSCPACGRRTERIHHTT